MKLVPKGSDVIIALGSMTLISLLAHVLLNCLTLELNYTNRYCSEISDRKGKVFPNLNKILSSGFNPTLIKLLPVLVFDF